MAQETVTIKGTKNGLVIILDPSGDFDELKNKLNEKISSARGFFREAKFSTLQQKYRRNQAIGANLL